jgi:hypothetical protein
MPAMNDSAPSYIHAGQKGWSGWGPHAAVFGKTPSETGLVTLSDEAVSCTDVEEELSEKPAVGTGKGFNMLIGADTGTSGLATWTPVEEALVDMTVDMTWDAPKKNIAIDGYFADWDCVPYKAQIPFVSPVAATADAPEKGRDGQPTIFEEHAGGIWNGIYDQSSAISFSWDEDSFYLGVKVVDDTHQLNGDSGWDGDSVQVITYDD